MYTIDGLLPKIYGPYVCADGRKRIILFYSKAHKPAKSYARYLMEQHLGRLLTDEETVDHIDNDFTNDDILNLQILSLADNIRKQQELSPRKLFYGVCEVCDQPFTKYLNHVLNNRKRGSPGPFCSRQCAGLRNAMIRYGRLSQLAEESGLNPVQSEFESQSGYQTIFPIDDDVKL